MKRNMGAADRLIRGLVVAPALAVVAVFVPAPWNFVAAVVAAIMLLTATIGFCPLYGLVGVNTCARRHTLGHPD